MKAKQPFRSSMDRLLGRPALQEPDPAAMGYLLGATALVTGAGGSIGSELVFQVAKYQPREMILLGHGENSIHSTALQLEERYPGIAFHCLIADIQDQPAIEQLFASYKPSVVFHAAAHKHVPLMESNVAAAVKNNIWGTMIVAEAARKYKADRFVCISTDKAVYPTNVMGMTKRVAERLIQQLNGKSGTQYAVVRFGNVLESRGSVIPIFKKQIAAGGPVTITHPGMMRYFMTIPEAVQLVLEAGALTGSGEIFVLDMGKPVRIVDVAIALIQEAGLEPGTDIDIRYTGIRPGEKLSESLFYEDEALLPAVHPSIWSRQASPMDQRLFNRALEQLELAIRGNGDIRQALEQMIGSSAGKGAAQ